MEFPSTQNLDIPLTQAEGSPKQVSQPKNLEKRRKSKPHRETSALNQRRDKRRRRTSSDAEDFNVNFSKIKISESSRVLRSKAKISHSSSFETLCEIQNYSQSYVVSKDHSYSKASKRLTKQKDQSKNVSTVQLALFIDLTEDNSYDRHKEPRKDVDPLPIKIEIIDFDDLELSNSSYEDHGIKCDHNSNNPAVENRNTSLTNPTDHLCQNVEISDDDQCTEVIIENTNSQVQNNEKIFEKPSDHHNKSKLILTDYSDQNFGPKTDFEKILAKYCDADPYLSKSTSFLEHWMLESGIDNASVIENPVTGSEDTSESLVYLDLDQNRIAASSPQKIAMIGQPGMVSIAGPVNFPSGGCFQKLVAASTGTEPESDCYNSTANSCLPFASTDSEQARWHQERSSSNDFPNLQMHFAHKIESLIRSKPPGRLPLVNSFSTSGGSIERIVSPVIPKQPSALKKYPGISVPFEERNTSTQELPPESTQFISQNVQQPECRIHLVETPPSFTRTLEPEVSQIMPRPQSNGGQNSMESQQNRTESGHLNGFQLRTPSKPKRTRRTRAQMEIYRQEMARTYNYRSKRNKRFASKSSRHIVGRNFSMEYHRLHSQPQNVLYNGLPTRVSHYMSPQAIQHHRYSETYSVNETINHFPNCSHDLAECQSFEPLWALNPFASTEVAEQYQKYQEPPMENLQNHSSVIWNQQARSIQLQSAYGNVHRPFTPWNQSVVMPLEHLSSHLTDMATYEPINQMQY